MSQRRVKGARALLIEATMDSIEKYGLAETSVSTITAEAGLSRGMVRHYFATKDAMMLAAYEALLEKWKKEFLEKRTGTPLQRIQKLIAVMYRPPNFTPRDLSVWIALNAAALHAPELAEMCRKEAATWTDVFREEIDDYGREVGRVFDSERIAETLIVTADGLWAKHMLDPERITPERALEINLALAHSLLGIDAD